MAGKYDYLVIGSGPAGHISAIRAAQLGMKVAVVEKDADMFGGVCLNEGCIPAKSLYHSAGIYDLIKKAPEICGQEAPRGAANLQSFVKKSREAADQLRKGLSFLFKKNGIDLLHGKACFLDDKRVVITATGGGDTEVEADNFLIATGSAPRELPGIPFDGNRVIDSSRAIRLEKAPGKILIVGGGAIGAEFASYFNMVGSEVTVVEMEEDILPGEDKEVARTLRSVFKRRGIYTLTGSRLSGVSFSGGIVTAKIDRDNAEESGEYDLVLVAIGRKPSTSGLGLEKAGVETDGDGFVRVNGEMRTNVDNIYAAGDVLRTPMLAHVASAEGEVAADAVCGENPGEIDYTSVPNAVYSQVQVASVGMTEEQAKDEGRDYSAGKQFFRAGGKAVVNSSPEGFIKVIADKASHRLLGAHIVGSDATELIHEFVVAKKAGLTVEDICGAVHAHPTFSETAVDACRAVFGRALHS